VRDRTEQTAPQAQIQRMHRPSPLLSIPGLIFLATALSACGLGAAMESCPDCGQVRMIEARVAHSGIGIYSSAGTTVQPVLFHVRVRMDRGYARDFTLSRADLRIGDRVEIRGGEPIAREVAARSP
jgi:hypothetical protein